jgi:FkbM family methyltransferase
MTHINYFDLGTYLDALEIELMLNQVLPQLKNITYTIYGVEAHPAYVSLLKDKYIKNDNIKIFNFAISNKEGTEKLYIARNPLGNSIFATKNNVDHTNYIETPCKTFSNWLREENICLENSINIIKVNIEGAELFLYEDLKQAGIGKSFQIVCGHISHDIQKVGELREKVTYYFDLMKELNINLIRFCGEHPELNIDMVAEINRLISERNP